jgi:adenosine deaminase
VARGLASQAVRYAELTLTPYSSIARGIAARDYCDAVEDARCRAQSDFGPQLRWCFDIPGESGIAADERTLEVALAQQPASLISFGLGGPEVGVSRQQFAPHFARARAVGLHSVPHAGESTGPESRSPSILMIHQCSRPHCVTSTPLPPSCSDFKSTA